MNSIAFAAFGIDKRRAECDAWRIPERTLVSLAIIGGSIGALAAMRIFHHKTRKPLFSIGVPLVLALEAALAIWLLTRTFS